MGTLTVRENLCFSAALRLPSSLPQSEKMARVGLLIDELGLTNVADSKVHAHTCSTCLSYTVKPYKPYEEGLIPYPTLILCVCVVSAGGHRDDKGNLRRREEENNDWHGAHK